MLTIDACVWVSVYEPADALHPAAQAFLRECARQHMELASPTLALLETGCALARRLRSPDKGMAAVRHLSASPLLRLTPLSPALERHALKIGTKLGLRAADAVYAALSVRLHADLVSTDRDLLDRTSGHLRAWTPAEWVAAHATGR